MKYFGTIFREGATTDSRRGCCSAAPPGKNSACTQGEDGAALSSHDVEIGLEVKAYLHSMGLAFERTFLTTVSSQGSNNDPRVVRSDPY